jgi:copper chaperone CopZ
VRVALEKVEGVKTVDVSLEKSSAVITFKANNNITLPQLRRIIRGSGYPTRDAQVEARGRIAERNGKPVFDLLNGSVLELAEKPADAPSPDVEITGVSRAVDRETDRLTIERVTRR